MAFLILYSCQFLSNGCQYTVHCLNQVLSLFQELGVVNEMLHATLKAFRKPRMNHFIRFIHNTPLKEVA